MRGMFPGFVYWPVLPMTPSIIAGLEIVAMIFFPVFLHDCWFYWSHRIEHKVPILREFHKSITATSG